MPSIRPGYSWSAVVGFALTTRCAKAAGLESSETRSQTKPMRATRQKPCLGPQRQQHLARAKYIACTHECRLALFRSPPSKLKVVAETTGSSNVAFTLSVALNFVILSFSSVVTTPRLLRSEGAVLVKNYVTRSSLLSQKFALAMPAVRGVTMFVWSAKASDILEKVKVLALPPVSYDLFHALHEIATRPQRPTDSGPGWMRLHTRETLR